MGELTEKKPSVTLIGKDGNAFAILGACQKALQKAKWTPTQIKSFMDEAMSGDYSNLLFTASKYLEIK